MGCVRSTVDGAPCCKSGPVRPVPAARQREASLSCWRCGSREMQCCSVPVGGVARVRSSSCHAAVVHASSQSARGPGCSAVPFLLDPYDWLRGAERECCSRSCWRCGSGEMQCCPVDVLTSRQPVPAILRMVHATVGVRARPGLSAGRADSHRSLRHGPNLAVRCEEMVSGSLPQFDPTCWRRRNGSGLARRVRPEPDRLGHLAGALQARA